MRTIFSITLIGLMALCIGTVGCRQEAAPEAKTRAPQTVRLIAAEEGRLPRTVTLTGTLAADQEVTSGFKVAGRVSEITVDLGSSVRKGEVLAHLDPTDFRLRVEQAGAALRQARARLGLSPEGADEQVDPEKTATVREARALLDEARLNRERMEKLKENDLIPQSDFDAAIAKFLVAEGRFQASIEDIRNRQALLAEKKSDLALAHQQLSDATLYAAMDGAVRERHATAGEFLVAGAPVVTLVRLHPLRLKAAVPERDAAAIRVGQPVKVQIEGDDAEYQGRLARLSPVIEEKTRTLAVEAEVDNQEGRIRPGSFARAEILVVAEQPVILVPAKAIVSFAGIEKVIGEQEGLAMERRVRTGRRSGTQVEIVEGLKPGELILAEPGNLAGGQPITVDGHAEAR